jgi:hypothetical protein
MIPSRQLVAAYWILSVGLVALIIATIIALIVQRSCRRSGGSTCSFYRCFGVGILEVLIGSAGITLALQLKVSPLWGIGSSIIAACVSGLFWVWLLRQTSFPEALQIWKRTILAQLIGVPICLVILAIIVVFVSSILFPPVF